MKKEVNLGIIIGLIGIIFALTGYIIYDKINYKNENEGIKEENITCNDCVDKIEFSKEGDSFTKNILLGNKIMKLEYYVDFNDNRTITIDEQVFDFLPPTYTEFLEIYILENEILMLVTTGSDIRTDHFEFYDSNLRKMDVETVLDSNYPLSMKIENYEVDGSTIKVKGTRLTHGSELVLEEQESVELGMYSAPLCYDFNIQDSITSEEIYRRHKGEIISANYKMEYLGNGKLSEFKRVEVLETLDENFCN